MTAGQVYSDEIGVDEELVIHFESSGAGPRTVLLVPGWTMSTRVFPRQLCFFEHSPDYRFVTYDPRGHGLSTNTPGGHHYEQHGRDLHAFIEALKLDDIVLGGWSFGVLDALAYVDQFGAGKLSGLIMLDGAPKARGVDNTTEWVSYRYDDADGREEFFTLGPLRDRAATNVEFAEWMLEDASERNIGWVCEITNQTSNEVAALLNAAGAFLDYSDVLKHLGESLPLLYVVSEELRDAVESWRLGNTPAAEVAAFGKHLMFWERPDEFNGVLDRYLRTIPS